MLSCMTVLKASAPVTEFARTTEVHRSDDGPGEFTVELDGGWSSLVGIHGGYMCAVAVRAAEAFVPDRGVRTTTTSFVRRGRVGPATISVREIRRGRSISTVVADLVQDGELVTITRLTLTVERAGVEWHDPSPLPLPPPEHCVPIDPPTGVNHFGRAAALLDPASLPFTGGEHARVSGYLRPLEDRSIDAAWLAMAVDWFPPPAFVRIDPPTGGISIDLTTHLHRPGFLLGGDEWLTASFEITNSAGGLAVEHGRIGDPHGRLVAESFQTRWTARA